MKDKFCCTKGVIMLFHFPPEATFHCQMPHFSFLPAKVGNRLIQNIHQESRGAVQKASDSGNKTSVEKAGKLWRDSSSLRRVEQTADDKVLT